jgi:ATP-binding cassette subfamily F protein 3
MVSHGGVAPFDGDLDDYQRYLLDEAKRQREAIKEAQNQANKQLAKAASEKLAASAPTKTPATEQVRKWKKEIEGLELRISTLNAEGADLEGKLGTNTHPTEIAEIGKSLKKVNDELKSLEDQWLKVSALLEG